MDTARLLLTLAPLAVGIGCSVGIYLKTRNGCETIGKIPLLGVLAGKACATKFAKWVVAVVAILCGCCGLMTMRALFGQ